MRARIVCISSSLARAVALAALLVGSATPGESQAADRADVKGRAALVFAPLPAEAVREGDPVNDAEIELGRRLYYEKRISKNHDLSCNSCHQLARFGVDNEPTSAGHKGQRGARNSPTTLNAAFHFAQFWDGRAGTVEEQAKGPVLNPVEMAMPSDVDVIAVIESIPEYPPLFAKAFPGDAKPVSYDNFGRAVGAFERRLVTPSRFDQFLGGQLDALSDAEVAGLDLFITTGCPTCHAGPVIGGAMYQKIGLVHPYETKDLGRYDVTKKDADKYFFKVPSLRNIEKTGPYFNDGKVATLDEAIRLMAWHQLGKKLEPAEVTSIATFLGSLTGTVDTAYVAEPTPFASGPKTPKPDPN